MTGPRLARRLLGLTLPAEERADVVANLDDLYADRLRRHGPVRAVSWYWVQAATFALRLRLAEVRPRSGRRWLGGGSVLRDLRFAVRQFSRAPLFTATALLTLALGVGATSVIYAIVYSVVLRPLPYPEAERLAWVWASGESPLTLKQFEDLRAAANPLAELTAFAGRQYAVVGEDGADEVSGLAVSANHFRVFGSGPLRGRGFQPQDVGTGAERVAVIGYDLWQTRFGGDSSIVGRHVDLYLSAAIPMIPGAFSGESYLVIGVAPPAYRPFGFAADVYTPLIPNAAGSGFADIGELMLVARLRAGVGFGQLRSELAAVVQRLPGFEDVREHVAEEEVVPLQEALSSHVRPAMLATLGAVGLVLLVACVNVANLLVVRTRDRRGEMALRSALGASRAGLIRQLLTESLVLSAVATGIGVGGAVWALPLAVRMLPSGLLAPGSIGLGGGPLAVSIGLLVVSVVVCGGLPAIDFGRRDGPGLGASRSVVGRRRHSLNHGLLVAEIGIAIALVYAAVLLSTSLARLTSVDPGFSADRVTTIRVAPSESRYRDAELRRGVYDRLLSTIRTWPEVRAAGAIHFLPIADGGPSIYFRADPGADDREASGYRVITPGYLEAMEIRLVKGRALGDGDVAGSPPVGLVNEALASRLWPGQDPLGKMLYRTNGHTFFTVVGVVADVRQAALGVLPQSEIYLPLAQSEWASAMTVVVRTTRPTPGLAASLRNLVTNVDPHLPVTRVATMTALLRDSVSEPRFYSLLFGLFGGLAFVLAVVGVYGVVSYVVGSRTDEIGLRMALGATGRDIAARELRRSGLVLLGGIALGVVVTVAAARSVAALLYGVEPVSLPVLGATVLAIGVVAAFATGIPIRRAARVDPMIALRFD